MKRQNLAFTYFGFLILTMMQFIITSSSFAKPADISEIDSLRTVYTLDEVTVYASSSRKSVSFINVINRDRIESHYSNSVVDIIENDPGIMVASGRKNSSDLSIRGANTQSMLFLVDGRPVNTGYFGGADLSLIPSDQIEKIQIIKGPAGVAYGANSLGGIVNVITRGGLNSSPCITVSSQFSSDNYREYKISAGADIGDYTGWFTYSDLSWDATRLSDEYIPSSLEDGEKRDNSDLRRSALNMKLARDLGSLGYASISYGYTNAEKGLPSSIYKPEYWRYADWLRQGGNLAVLLKPYSTLNLKLDAFRNNYADELVNYLDNTYSTDKIDYDSDMHSLTWGGSVEASWEGIAQNILSIGTRFNEDHSQRRDLRPETPWINSTSHLTSLYIEDSYSFRKDITATAGIGSYGYSLLQSGTDIQSTGYMAGVSKDIDSGLSMALATSRSIFFPTHHNLFSAGRGNPDLEPEEAWKYEFKINSDTESSREGFLSFEMSLFYNRMRNQIDLDSNTRLFINIKSLSTWGMETAFNARLNRHYSLETTLAVMDWDAGNDELYSTPHVKAGIRGSFKDFIKSKGYVEATMFRERLASIGGERIDTMPAYLVVNVGYKYMPVDLVTFNLDVRNLLDRDYEEVYGYPAPGRLILGGMTVSFSR